MARVLFVGAVAAVTMGCTDGGSADGEGSTDVVGPPRTSVADGPVTPGGSPTTAPAPSPSPGATTTVRCAGADRDEMAATVGAQLAAIAADEWTTALGFTTSAFRAGIDEDAFEELIVDGFPVVADGVAADPLACVTPPDGTAGPRTASLLVTVEDSTGAQQDLVYLFRIESEEWRISGAVPADGDIEDDTATI